MENINMKILLLAFLVVGANCSCCFPEQFEGVEGMSAGEQRNGTGIAFQFMFHFSWDSINNKVAYSGTEYYNGKPIKVQALQDYGTGKQYLVLDGKCQKSDMPETKMTKCIPPGSKKVMSSYYGYLGPKIAFDMYNFKVSGVDVTISVETGKICAPFAEHIQTSTGIYDVGFMGLTPGIKRPEVFNVPAACKGEANEQNFSNELHRRRKIRPSVFGTF